MGSYFSSNYNNVSYPIAENTSLGLRNAQIGAIHAIASFFTMNKNQAAIIVMPTGAGKTAVLMMTPYLLRKDKVLVVTPSVMVRGQIAEDFQGLNTLCRAGVFKPAMEKPCVYEMCHKYSDELLSELDHADVIVATPQCALSLSETEWATESISLVLVDEAHHTPAHTWQQILINLAEADHVLFTATPFRLDRKAIKGEIIYDYPLSMAYKDGIFGEIEYIPLPEGDKKDIRIAKKAEEVLFADRDDGLEHFLMVRTDSKKNAELLEQLYQENTSLKLKRIDSSMSNKRVKQYIQELKDRRLDGIICVDMLGEGFDFPNLKIAAVHAPHKSLASTLQFVGRFARTNAENIGAAKFIAINDEELEIENSRLYARDSVWQEMIINMSEGKNHKELAEREYFKEYEATQESTEEGRISLRSIVLNCHDRIYRVTEFDIEKDFPDNFNIGRRVHRNRRDNTIIGIGMEAVPPLWMAADSRINRLYYLYIVHYQESLGLLHIYSQKHSESVYEAIAEAFCKKYEKIPKSEMNRVLGNLSGFEFFNSGMVNRFNESGEAYRIMAGHDVSDAIDPSTGKMYSAGHVFCKATDSSGPEDENITIGYSSASKVWSSQYRSIPDYIFWVEQLGAKIADSGIQVKTHTNFDYIPMPEKLYEFPGNIFFADFSDSTYSSPPVIKRRSDPAFSNRITDCNIQITNVSPEYVTVVITNDNSMRATFSCDTQGKYSSEDGDYYLHLGSEECDLEQYLCDNPLAFKTLDDALIIGSEIYKGTPDSVVFDQSQIMPLDWEAYNTDVTREIGTTVIKGKISIQSTIEKMLVDNEKNKFVMFDHSSGEIADFIAVQETENQVIVRFYHAKKMNGKEYNSRVDDIYEVAGQAVKSISWLSTKGTLVAKMNARRSGGHCMPIKGDYHECVKLIRDSSKQLIGYIVIVQPALSRTVAMEGKIQEVLASASTYIKRAGKVRGLEILGSK